MWIPQDCIHFYNQWSQADDENETFDDLDTMDLVRVILSIHYDFHVRTGTDPDGLQVLDNILEKVAYYLDGNRWVRMDPHTKRDRAWQVRMAKDLVRNEKLSLPEAICLLFTKTELGIYGI